MEPNPPIRTIVAIYADRVTAERAAQAVVRNGVPAADVHLHERGTSARNAAGITVDEYATGGFFSNFASLLTGLLNARRAPGTAQSYAEVVQLEEVALSVEARSEEQAAAAESDLREAGALKVASASH